MKDLKNKNKEVLRMKLNTKENILQHMYDLIYSEDYDYGPEKEVLKEKIKDEFGIQNL